MSLFLGICLIILITALGINGDNGTTCACGWRNSPNLKVRKSSIIGGTEAHSGEWPYQVLLRCIVSPKKEFMCGGTIITKRHVLSAAHCFLNLGLTKVTIEYDVEAIEVKNPSRIAEKIYTHENYNDVNYLNDISLILIDGEFPFDGQRIGPVCVGINRVPDGESVIALGWGLINAGKEANKLQMVTLTTKNIHKCDVTKNEESKLICTQMIDKSICNGDSGGPLLMYDRQIQRYILVGITSSSIVKSKGDKSCPGIADMYTDVSSFKNWIIDKIKLDTNLDMCTRLN